MSAVTLWCDPPHEPPFRRPRSATVVASALASKSAPQRPIVTRSDERTTSSGWPDECDSTHSSRFPGRCAPTGSDPRASRARCGHWPAHCRPTAAIAWDHDHGDGHLQPIVSCRRPRARKRVDRRIAGGGVLRRHTHHYRCRRRSPRASRARMRDAPRDAVSLVIPAADRNRRDGSAACSASSGSSRLRRYPRDERRLVASAARQIGSPSRKWQLSRQVRELKATARAERPVRARARCSRPTRICAPHARSCAHCPPM